jgi:DNA modification methylase
MLTEAAHDKKPISGWTHNFYRYPARFSPVFAATAIKLFSKPGDLILDPYMGGGTAIVEAIVAGRLAVGNDLNSLACFIAKAKTTKLSAAEAAAIREWANEVIPGFSYRAPIEELAEFVDPIKTRNLSLVRARFIKKATAAALASMGTLPSINARNFAKCVVLRTCQWALDGRQRHTTLSAFRMRMATSTEQMLAAIHAFANKARESGGSAALYNTDAKQLEDLPIFKSQKAQMVITSPPYPGVHVLYHRWQVDGRRETPAPYWITGCNDGQGASYYNFGDRRQAAADNYFRTSLMTLHAIRKVMANGGYIVQMVAFNKRDEQLPRYLENMDTAGFKEVSAFTQKGRIWRDVPSRKWHATLHGQTESSKEMVIVHRAK